MSRVERLVRSRDSLSVKFLEFTRIASKGKEWVAVFFEGEDEKYYSVRINNIRSDIKWVGINCGGKEKVLQMRSKIRSHQTYNRSYCVFFVDADFDDNSDIVEFSDTYITPCYSIENLYLSDPTFVRILNAEFGLSEVCESNSCFHKSLELFKKSKSDYLYNVGAFNFLIRELRIMERNGALTTKLNINNINFDDLIMVNLDSSQKRYDETNPSSIFSELPENLPIDLLESESHFSNLDPELTYRGKQHLEFMRLYISRLKEDRCRKASRKVFQEKGNVRLHLTKSNSISELSQYADTPNCLKAFLENQTFNQVVA